MMKANEFSIGDWVVFQKTKFSLRPGPRAFDVTPSPHGDGYTYLIEKFWQIIDIDEDTLVVKTRRGKIHRINATDLRVRKVTWWDRIWHRDRLGSFPESQTAASN